MGVLFCAGVTAGTGVLAGAAAVVVDAAAATAGAFVRRAGRARAGGMFVTTTVGGGTDGSSAACALNASATASDRSFKIGFTVIPVVKATVCRRIEMSGR